jgi:fumarate hydratase subunit alpha
MVERLKKLFFWRKKLYSGKPENSSGPEVAELERELLEKVNRSGIGPMGYGGRNTALAVNVEVFPSHMGSLPVAVNLNCHSSRHKEAVI